MRPQFTEHGQDIGVQPRVIGIDIRELHGARVCFHCVTRQFVRTGADVRPGDVIRLLAKRSSADTCAVLVDGRRIGRQ